MGKTSSAVKLKYNKKTYKQFNVQIKPELFKQIDDYCTKNKISRSTFLSISITELTKSED